MESLSIEQINKLQEENEAYKQSEQEASEIIAELKYKNKTLKKKLNCFKAALEEIRKMAEKSIEISYNLEVNSMLYDITDKIKEVLK